MAIERTGKAKELYEKANKLAVAKDWESAIAEYGEVIKLLPNDADSYKNRGDCYKRLEQWENAFADISKAISLEPKNSGYYCSRACWYVAAGEMEKAKADIEKMATVATKEDTAKYYYFFGYQIQFDTGDKKEAAVYLKKSIELGDWNGEAKKELDKLGV